MPIQPGNVFTGIGFCVPLAGRPVPPDWAFAFKSIGPPINFNMMHMSTVKMKVDAARNKSAEWAVENKLKYLFFMGDDTVPPAHVLRRFIFLMENNPEIEVLGGIYFTKEEHPMPLVFRGNGAGPYWDWKVGELFAVSGIGMDCTLIRTSLFSKLKKPWFKTINADTYAEDIPKVECWTEDLYFCFPSGSYVYGDVLPIEQYGIGNQVVADSGKIRDVLNTNVRDYKGELVRVSPAYGCGFDVTPKHEVQAIRNGKKVWVYAENLTTFDYLVVPFGRQDSLGHKTNILPVWPHIRGKHVEFAGEKFRYTRTRKSAQWFPLKVVANEDVCALSGYWVAEGSADHETGNVTFTFHEKELEFANDVQRLLNKCFGLESVHNHYPESKTRVVLCSNVALADFMIGTFGKYSSERRVPEEIMRSHRFCMKSFLKHYWRGDGSKHGEYKFSTTSKRLAHDLRWMLIRLGIYCSFSERIFEDCNISYSLRPARKFHEEWCGIIEQLEMERDLYLQQKVARIGTPQTGGEFHVAIESILFVPYDGKVHNLKIKTDSTYNINGFSVHNCDQIEKQLDRKWNKRPAIFADASILCDHWDVSAMKKYSLPWNSKPATRSFAHGTKKILDLGCGLTKQVFKDGIPIRVDIRDEAEPDYRCDLRALPFKDEFADIVHSAQTLEHFDRKEVMDVLDEWLRVLKYKGELRIEVPNLEYTAKEILKSGGLSESGMDILYGQQKYPEDFHKCGFTPALLKHVLQAKGMKVKRIWSNTAWTICAEAIKMKRREGIGDGEGSRISKESVEQSLALNNSFIKTLTAGDESLPKTKKKAKKKRASYKLTLSKLKINKPVITIK
jgi:predicted SAM-dependent methyltransferase